MATFCYVVGYGQDVSTTGTVKGKGKVSGVVLDESNQMPIEFATVALTTPESDRPIDGTVCDAKGKFVIKGLTNGKYQLIISFIGFENKTISFEILEDKDVDLETILLKSNTKVLEEVTVEGQKPLIEERVDRTVFNAENDATAQGGDATDVLKRVPMLSVDLDGNVSLRGSQNVRILINNKPSTIVATSVADALKQIPAEQIKSVEVITSPSAKYDAEGTGGIINIITKKNTMQGATLNINSSAGVRGSNLGLNGNLRTGKLGLSLGGFGRAGYNIKGAFKNSQETTSRVNLQQADTHADNLFGNYTLGIDYDFDKFNFITSSVKLGLRNGTNYQDNLLTQRFEDGTLAESSLRNVKTVDNSVTTDISLGYTHLYKKPQRELSAMVLYSRNNRINDFVNSIITQTNTSLPWGVKNENNSFNEESTVQLDYQTPVGTKALVEAGGKQIIRRVSSDYQYFFASGPGEAYILDQRSERSNVFNYDQNVTAMYTSFTYNTQKAYSFKAGVRYEYTTIHANFQDNREIELPAYNILVPSVNVARKFKSGNMLKASYSQRVQRPSIQYLNPNLQTANPLNITVGNPDLRPEFTNNYELAYSTLIKQTFLNFSGFVRTTNKAIQSVRDVIGEDTIRTTYRNIGHEAAYGINIFANVNIGRFMLNGGTDLFYAVVKNNVTDPLYNASNEGWVMSYRVFGGYNLDKGWGFQIFGFYRARQVQLQGYQGGFGIYSLSIKKDFNNKKGSMGIGAENFVTKAFKMRNEVKSPILSQNSVSDLYLMNFKINFNYTIGKMRFDQSTRSRRKRSINNDDLKDGGDGQMMDQGAGGSSGPAPGGRSARPTQGYQNNTGQKKSQ